MLTPINPIGLIVGGLVCWIVGLLISALLPVIAAVGAVLVLVGQIAMIVGAILLVASAIKSLF